MAWHGGLKRPWERWGANEFAGCIRIADFGCCSGRWLIERCGPWWREETRFWGGASANRHEEAGIPACGGADRDGDDRELAVCMDAVCGSDSRGTGLEPIGSAGGVHAVHCAA